MRGILSEWLESIVVSLGIEASRGVLLIYLLFAVVWGLIFIRITLYWVRWKTTRSGHQSNKRGLQKEKEAEKWFLRQGYRILSSQPVREGFLLLDQKKEQFEVQPDFILEKQGQKWVVDVKSGRHGSVTLAATRRQLREYAAMFPECKCGMLDARSWTFHEIEFIETQQFAKAGVEGYSIEADVQDSAKSAKHQSGSISWFNWWKLLFLYAGLILLLGTIYWILAL